MLRIASADQSLVTHSELDRRFRVIAMYIGIISSHVNSTLCTLSAPV